MLVILIQPHVCLFRVTHLRCVKHLRECIAHAWGKGGPLTLLLLEPQFRPLCRRYLTMLSLPPVPSHILLFSLSLFPSPHILLP